MKSHSEDFADLVKSCAIIDVHRPEHIAKTKAMVDLCIGPYVQKEDSGWLRMPLDSGLRIATVAHNAALLGAMLYHICSVLERAKNQVSTYAEYLASPEWEIRRRWMLHLTGGRCQLCNSDKNVHVHHRTYANARNELPSDLTVLCADCHARFHNKV